MLFESNKEHPACYSVLDKVFPISIDGLREVRSLCWNCSLRIECLRDAIKKNEQVSNIKNNFNNENISESGLVAFIQRWSRLKKNSRI